MSDGRPRAHDLSTRILYGLLLGAAAGSALNLLSKPAKDAPPSPVYDAALWFADNVANPAGQVFLRILFMVVVPLVFCSLTLGVAGIGSLKSLGRLGARALGWFVGTTALAVAIGLLLVNTVQPGRQIDAAKAAEIRAEFQGDAGTRLQQAREGTGFSVDTFVRIVPRNVVKAAGDERETLGVIFFALMVGIALTALSQEGTRTFREFLRTLYDCCVVILGYAMRLAPYGVAGLIFTVTLKLGIDVLGTLLAYVAVALGGLLLHQFVVLGILARTFGGVAPREFFRRTRLLMVTAFSTSSSNATLPTTMRTAIDEFGVPERIAGFVLPLGATMNMNGTALFEGVAVLFLAQVAGVDLSLASQALVILLAVLTAIGAAGVPGGSLPLLAVVLGQVGVPPEMLGLILGVDRLVDMARTVPNVCSDLLCALWLTRGERGPPAGPPPLPPAGRGAILPAASGDPG
jgi:DAACS family dicarboxylate/amino acid:cation (Na+ or H+) symporter